MRRLVLRLLLALLSLPGAAFAQATGALQIHHMNVGQGDGAVIISPLGEVVMVDNGPNQCATPVAYLQNLGVSQIDYHIASHYHADHIGCTPEVLAAFPLTGPRLRSRGHIQDPNVPGLSDRRRRSGKP